MRAALALPVTLLALAACGVPPQAGLVAGANYTLYEAAYSRQSTILAVIDSHTRATQRTLPLGAPAVDWTHLYSVVNGSLVDTNPLTGAVLHSVPLPGPYGLPNATMSGVPGGLSQNGQWLALQSFDGSPGAVTASHLLLFNTALTSPPVRVELQGDFEFDAISNDGHHLYLIEYLGVGEYRVRLFDVAAALLEPGVVVDKTNPAESMAGYRVMGVPSTGGQWLYSVYVRQKSGAFIHALNLDGGFAFCIDLPGSGYETNGDEFSWSLALSPDGGRLYAVNAAMGVVSEIDTQGPTLTRTVALDAGTSTTSSLVEDVEAKAFGANGTVVSPDGATLATVASTGVLWIDTAALRARARALAGWRVWSLGLSPDGKTLYALRDSGAIAQLSMAGHGVEETFDPGAGDPMALMGVAPA